MLGIDGSDDGEVFVQVNADEAWRERVVHLSLLR